MCRPPAARYSTTQHHDMLDKVQRALTDYDRLGGKRKDRSGPRLQADADVNLQLAAVAWGVRWVGTAAAARTLGTGL